MSRVARSTLLVLTLALLTVAPGPALHAREDGPRAQGAQRSATPDLRATRAFYAELIAGPEPDLATLALFMRRMPKGGDLHHHYSGTVYAETYLAWVRAAGACIWRSDQPDLPGATRFSVWDDPDALSDDHRADCLDVDTILSGGDDDDFRRELISAWSMLDFGDYANQDGPGDQHFFATFPYFGALATENLARGLEELKARAIAENVQYIETIVDQPPAGPAPAAGAATDPGAQRDLAAAIDALPADASDASVREALAAYADFLAADAATQATVAEYLAGLEAAAAGIDDADFTLRYQLYVVRSQSPSQVFARLHAAFIAGAAGGRVVGVNLVGPENRPVAMRDYRLHMRMLAFLKERYPSVRIALHAGELTVGLVPPAGLRHHIRDAIEIAGAERIGHGVDIAYEDDAPGLLREMRARGVTVEINLTSNEVILGVQDRAHPILLYRRFGVPFVISTDDSGVARNDLSSEYVLFASRYRPSYDALKAAVFRSIRASFLTDAEKAVQLAALERRFATFEAEIAGIAATTRGGAGS